jgi:hypothetical protein
MFSHADDIRAGVPIVTETYADGEPGIQKSLAEICRKVREGAPTAVMKSFAGNVLKQAGFPRSARERATALFEYVRKNVGYMPDALGTEQIQTAAVTLCVDGAPICIPIGDCFPVGTLLLRSDYALVPIEKIKVGERIWGRDGWTEVKGKAFKGPKNVDVLVMNNGSHVPLTAEHKVYVVRCDRHADRAAANPCQCPIEECRVDRIPVSEVQETDRLVQPKRIAFGKETPDLDRTYIEGLYASDGWAEEGRFAISGQDGCPKEQQKYAVKEACERLGVATYWSRKYIRINDGDWAERVAQMGTHAPEKHLLSIDLGEAAAAATLRGVMADSGANANGGRTFTTTSKQLMVQTRVLHRMFGISCSSRFIEDHGGLGKNPIWRLGVREPSQKAEKILRVKSIERSVYEAPCYDIQTEDHYVYLPEHDVTVSNCDDLTTATATLCAAAGLEVEIVRQFFGSEHQQHVMLEVKLENGRWFPLDPSSQAMKAGEKAPASSETRCSPWDGKKTGLSDDAQFVGIGTDVDGVGGLPVFVLTQTGKWQHAPSQLQLGGQGDNSPVWWYEASPGVEANIRPAKVKGFGVIDSFYTPPVKSTGLLADMSDVFLSNAPIPKLSAGATVGAAGAILLGSVAIAAWIRRRKVG